MFWLYNQGAEEKEEKQEISTRDIFNAIALVPVDKQTSLNLLGNRLPLDNSTQDLGQQAIQYEKAAVIWLYEAYKDLERKNAQAASIILEQRVLSYQRVASGLRKNHIENRHGLGQTFDIVAYEKYLQAEAKLSEFYAMLRQEKTPDQNEALHKVTNIAKAHLDAKAIGLALYRSAQESVKLPCPRALIQIFYALAAENLRSALDQSGTANNELFNIYRKATEKSWELFVLLKDDARKDDNVLDLSYYNQIEKNAGDEMEFLSARLLAQQAQQRQPVRAIKNIDNIIEAVTPHHTLRRVNKFRHKA